MGAGNADCKGCRRAKAQWRYECADCRKPTGVPSHVALAVDDEPSLRKRFDACRNGCPTRPARKRIEQVVSLVNKTGAVSINMQPEALLNLFVDPRVRYVNLHDNLRAAALIEYDDKLAAKRKGLDCLIFGADGTSLAFGALNLGTIGLVSYGAVCVFLSNETAARTAFLEENSFSYLAASAPAVSLSVPPGARARSKTVSLLAAVKHRAELETLGTVSRSDIAGLLIRSVGDKKTDRFIEAQVAPPITQASIARVLYDPSADRAITAKGLVGRAARHSRALAAQLLQDRLGRRVKVEIVGQEGPRAGSK